MPGARNTLLRLSALFVYLAAFITIQIGLGQYMSTPSPPINHIFYSEENTPDYFPVLLQQNGKSSSDGLLVHSLPIADHGTVGSKQLREEWHIYQANGEGRLANSSLVTYTVEPLSTVRHKITLSLNEENQRRASIYTYEVEADRIYPREHLLQSYVGDNFSPMPFTVGLTLLIILLGEKIVLKRLKTPRPNAMRQEQNT